MSSDHAQHDAHDIRFPKLLGRLSLMVAYERRILGLLASYALAIGLFSVIAPLTIQELVNTFAFSIQPIMIVTLAGIMVLTLLFVGAFKALQFYAVEILERRIFARVALGLTQQLPHFREESFLPKYVNYFMETVLMQRALSSMLIEIINVVLGGIVGMTILVFYHPYFLLYDIVLLGGFTLILATLSQGGLRWTLAMSQAKYDAFSWLQEIGGNLLHFKSTVSGPLLLKKTDQHVQSYVEARKARFTILMRQYLGSLGWQAVGHGGLVATAGWLLAEGQLTVGQFVAAEAIVSGLLVSFDAVVKRINYIFYFMTSLTELDSLFSLPKDTDVAKRTVPLPDPTLHGIRLTCRDVAFAYPDGGAPVFQGFNVEIAPGEKVAVFSHSSSGKTTLARVLAGLYLPTGGVMRYNGVDVRDLDRASLNACRGLVLDSQLHLFEGTLEENITLGRPSITYADVLWALRFVELEEEVDALPLGLRAPIQAKGKNLTTSQILRVLLARAIVTRPQLLILDGTLHNMPPQTREIILRRLCSKEEPWSVVFVSNDPSLAAHVDRRLTLD